MAMTWRPPDHLARRLRVVCALTEQSANGIITQAVTDWLDHNEPDAAKKLLADHQGTSEGATEH